MNKRNLIVTASLFSAIIVINSCSKGGGGDNNPPPPPSACASITITVTATGTDANTCQTNGTITAAASGSTGFTYSVNGVNFQSSGAFSNLSAGNYTVTAKDVNGCTKTANVAIGNGGTAGPLFTVVRNLMTINCQPCHNNSIANGGMNWAVDCNIVANQGRIKVRAVDQGTMPPTGPLPQADRDKIAAWIAAGGRFTD